MDLLRFSLGKNNGKLRKLEEKINKKVYVLNLLAGHTCFGALDCLAKAVEQNGTIKIENGAEQQFRCYAASLAVAFPSVYKNQKYNTDLVRSKKTRKQFFDLLDASLPKDAQVIRIHSSGDMICQNYFDAWIDLANKYPKITFYAYTKSLPLWVKRLGQIPKNLILTASWGGKFDKLIIKHNLRSARVVFSEKEAKDLKLDIDINDFSAYNPKKRYKNFALLIHGVQSPSSAAGTALKLLNKTKKGSKNVS